MKRDRNTLAVRFGKRASKMLVEFANCLPEKPAFLRFKNKWEKVSSLKWLSGYDGFLSSQKLLREIWEGKKRGIEGFQVGLCLGIEPQGHYAEEGEMVPASPIAVDWHTGQLELSPRNLEDVVWLTITQCSRRLGVCGNKHNECPTPYFLKYRPRQEFCSDICAKPRQREFKRDWWAKHGKEWKRKNEKK